MGKKICPLSFFNFYINKETAQAGGAHDCVEDACAIWDETCQQCSIKSGLEAVAIIADFIASSSNDPLDRNINSSSPIADILTKLRMRKKVNESPKINEPLIPVVPSSAKSVETNITPTPSKPVEETLKTSDILDPPKIPISELPIVSISEPKNETIPKNEISEIKNG